MDCLYHYCSNEKCFNILKNKTIRLCDIEKSNDYLELRLFFPDILEDVEDIYFAAPFKLKYTNKQDGDALHYLLRESYDYWDERFSDGSFTNFVMCFSETKDALSQWRGYADNGKGCCIGFSKRLLQEYCENNREVLHLRKVVYCTPNQIQQRIKSAAKRCVEELRSLREWIVEKKTKNDDDPDTDGLMGFNFNGMLENAFIDSLCIKSESFIEENEWRIFLNKPAYKNPDWVLQKKQRDMIGPKGFSETVEYLNNKIEFHITEDDIIPYCPIRFSEFQKNPVAELWTGPKNKIRESDMELFLKQNDYITTKSYHSHITYR